MGKCISLTEDKNIPIQVISVTDTTGVLKPLRFRYEDKETHVIQTVIIKNIDSNKQLNYVGYSMEQFICSAIFNDTLKMFELRYLINTHKWVFFQMLN